VVINRRERNDNLGIHPGKSRSSKGVRPVLEFGEILADSGLQGETTMKRCGSKAIIGATYGTLIGTLLTFLHFTTPAQAQMRLDQRNMSYESGPKPLTDFAQIPGPNGVLAGTISMIDGNQVAYFDSSGRIVSGKGRFEYKAKTPAGLYMNSAFDYLGQPANGGVQVADLIITYRFNGAGPNALQYVHVEKIVLASDKFKFAYTVKGTKDIKEGSTTVTEHHLDQGYLYLTLSELGQFGAGKTFKISLVQPLQGSLVLVDATSAGR
jgi:hypothetical protein